LYDIYQGASKNKPSELQSWWGHSICLIFLL
jgi:hypothetical protein